MWPVEIAAHAMLTGPRIITFSIIKSETISIYRSLSFNGKIIGIHRIEENDISITRRNALACGIVFPFGTSP